MSPRVLVLQRDPRAFAEWHRKISVHAIPWIHTDQQRIYCVASCKTVEEKITQRTLHRGDVFIIPIDAQNEVAQHKSALRRRFRDSRPYVPDLARATDVRQRDGLADRYAFDTGRSLARPSQCARSLACRAFFSGAVFPVDRTRALMPQPRKRRVGALPAR